jgi:hypothetical protein
MNLKILSATVAGALALAMAGSALGAQVVVGAYTLQDGSFGGQLGVHSDGSATASTVSGHVNNEGSDVTFSTTTGVISINGIGEAIIDGDPLLENLLVTFEHGWGSVTFDLESPTHQQDPDFDVSNYTLLVNGLTTFSLGGSPSCTFCLVTNGTNKFILTGPSITTLQFNFDPAIQQAKQFRVEGVGQTAVPEPATWAMLMFGLGGVGALMRQRRRLQAAT